MTTEPSETSTLLPSTNKMESEGSGNSNSALSTIFLLFQAILFVFFAVGTSYDYSDEATFDAKEYVAFRDIMAMLLLGFGYLMTFLKDYGLGAVGLTMMLSILSMELNIAVELAMRYVYYYGFGATLEDADATSWPMPVTMATLIDAEFAAATLMITFGALIGRATPLQMMAVCLCQSVAYTLNKVVFVLGFIGAEDVGGSMTIHMFGAYFGLAASCALGPLPTSSKTEAEESNGPDKVSDLTALIGTTILWVFWPSFVGATETGVGSYEQFCVINTILALLASTTMTFFLSQKLTPHGKLDPVHIANSTLAGGVAIGSAARLNIGPAGAILTGSVAGAVSVFGYVFSSPFLESKWGIMDTCGVGNLHGYPSVAGATLSIIFVALDSSAEFLVYSDEVCSQMLAQAAGIAATLILSCSTGYATGLLVKPLKDEEATANYLDSVWWHLEY
ncbi:Ammonium transporter Rh type [Seminavis robusta]|uniref:Ammonium transporter Rh type n=1 Tax=Seminavis robusta TaxID=568900 RepID=A0A9N8EQ78_9STRA|nr:Ammonium transporter Rh type [Seminavis robusta]|eukprot:Sro1380_g267750.1 Ammonium transporter Rh type (449) ;mRNA; f:3695-5041